MPGVPKKVKSDRDTEVSIAILSRQQDKAQNRVSASKGIAEDTVSLVGRNSKGALLPAD